RHPARRKQSWSRHLVPVCHAAGGLRNRGSSFISPKREAAKVSAYLRGLLASDLRACRSLANPSKCKNRQQFRRLHPFVVLPERQPPFRKTGPASTRISATSKFN